MMEFPADNNNDEHSLAVWEVTTTKQGKIKRVVTYVDLHTGEIIPAKAARCGAPKDLRKRLTEQARTMNSLRPEVVAFARFVLDFRNRRRGISPGISVLAKWWAALAGRQVSHVRRYITRLKGAGMLAGENLVGPIWQRAGGNVRGHLGEDVRSAVTHSTEYLSGRRGPRNRSVRPYSVERDPDSMHWAAFAEPTGNLLTYEAYASLRLRLFGKQTHTDPHEFAVRQSVGIERGTRPGQWRTAFSCPIASLRQDLLLQYGPVQPDTNDWNRAYRKACRVP